MKKDKLKILVFGAHPDDIETGMGGTVALLKQAGHEIVWVVTTLPDANSSYLPYSTETKYVTRKREGNEAAGIIGIEPLFFDVLTELDSQVTEESRKVFKGLIKDINPDVVFTQWPVDVNPDHRALGILSIEPCLQKGVNIELFCYEVFSEPGRPQSLGFYPTHYVNIDSVLDVKEKMVRCHKSQLPNLWEANIEMQLLRGNERFPKSNGHSEHHMEAFVRLTRFGPLNEQLAEILMETRISLPSGMGVKVDPAKIGLQVPA